MKKLIHLLFFNVIVRFVVLVLLGLNVRHRHRLPDKGPAIVIANHNSHLDTMVVMTLLSPKLLSQVQPVAAMEYFLRNRLLAWFALNVIGILPIQRKQEKKGEDSLAPVDQALKLGKVLIFFPEGSRGEPERLAGFKKGIARLAQRYPDIPVIPIYLHGLGKALPKGEALLVPFFCDVFIGEPLSWQGDRNQYMQKLEETMQNLAEEGNFSSWE